MANNSSFITLTCENYHQTLTAALWNFLQSKRGTDLNVEWGGHLIRVHRLMLDIFLSTEKLLQTAAETGQQRPHDGKDLGSLLKFLYQGKVVVSKNSLENLTQIAKNSDFKLLVDVLETAKGNMASVIVHQDHHQKGWLSEEDNANSESWKLQLNQMKLDPHFDETDEAMATGDQEIPDELLDWRTSSDSSNNDNEYSQSDANARKFGVKGKARVSSSTYQCGMCDKSFSLPRRLIQHQEMHKKPRERFKCSDCGKEYQRLPLYQRHILKHDEEPTRAPGERPYKCSKCDKAYSRALLLKYHEKVHSIERDFICEQCGKTFTRAALLACHLKTHDGLRPFECLKCHRNYTSKGALSYHEQISHSDNKRPYTCDFCHKSFSSKGHLKSHCEIHANEALPKQFSCHVCGKQYRRHFSLADHIRYVHGGEVRPKFKKRVFKNGGRRCEICGEVFTTSYFYTHMAMHKYGKPVTCGYCPKTFFNVTQQKIHERIHTGQKPFNCTVCERTFRQSSQARRHMQRIHAEKVPIPCSYCQKIFYNQDELRRHSRLHTGEKLHRCEYPDCQRVFTVLSRKVRHFLTHCKDRTMYSCPVCNKSFTRPDNLRAHQLTHPSADGQNICQ